MTLKAVCHTLLNRGDERPFFSKDIPAAVRHPWEWNVMEVREFYKAGGFSTLLLSIHHPRTHSQGQYHSQDSQYTLVQ